MIRAPKKSKGKLSPREEEVLRRLGKGYDAPEIANLLGITEPTVRTFIRNILRKLKAKNIAHAVNIATRRRLI